MPSAGPVNKLVMESVDTQQHSTELLDNLQIRTFDAFLLKAEPSCLLSARKHMTQVCLSGMSEIRSARLNAAANGDCVAEMVSACDEANEGPPFPRSLPFWILLGAAGQHRS